ncbi:MAG TPA: protein-disulfide reductase DsbD N-terminal domain-containing protein [Candidatus Angelobacter sp.]|nr:protein-disulfide reductase DsbD N-terminal domain-containing protein [Candidatus Angelobacter sp.]
MKLKSVSSVLFALAFAGSTFSAAQSLSPAAHPEKVSFEPVGTIAVNSAHPAPLRLVFRIEPGFHINSNKPSMPELIPTAVHFSLPDDVVIGRLKYPAGQLKSFPFDPTEKLSVYSGDVVITGRVIAPLHSAPGTYTVHGGFKYQACDNNACYPPKTLPIIFNVKVGRHGSSVRRARPNAQSPHVHN